MTRLIDADALNEKLCKTTIFIKDGEMFQRMINDAPTIEPDADTISRSQAIKDISEWATDILHPDRLVKEDAIHILESLPSAEPKTGKWVLDPNGMDWNIPAWRCSECGFVANYIGVEAKGFGNNPMNWAGSKFCPNCGVRITGYER